MKILWLNHKQARACTVFMRRAVSMIVNVIKHKQNKLPIQITEIFLALLIKQVVFERCATLMPCFQALVH